MTTPFFKLSYRTAAVLVMPLLLAISAGADADLVFSALQDGTWQLYGQADPRSPPQPIPTPGIAGDKAAPRLSPDGTRVAFEVTGGGLWVCPVAGTAGCRALAVGPGSAVRPAWHPRTGELVFVRYAFTADAEQSTIELAAGDLDQIRPVIEQTGIQDFPAVAPDGGRLVYTSWLTVMPYRGRVAVVQQLWTLDLVRGRAGQLLLSNASDIHPRWSPDGARIAFSSNRTGHYEIWTVGADGTGLRQVTAGPGEKTWPAWSPDGSRILFTHTREGLTGLSLVGAEGGADEPMTPFGPDAQVQIKDPDWVAARQP